jgi:hypothetical protein
MDAARRTNTKIARMVIGFGEDARSVRDSEEREDGRVDIGLVRKCSSVVLPLPFLFPSDQRLAPAAPHVRSLSVTPTLSSSPSLVGGVRMPPPETLPRAPVRSLPSSTSSFPSCQEALRLGPVVGLSEAPVESAEGGEGGRELAGVRKLKTPERDEVARLCEEEGS